MVKYGLKEFMINIKCIFQIIVLKIFRNPSNKKIKYQISITCVLRDEATYIKEWLDFYILLGIEHFYIYDNKSKDDITKILESYINEGVVTYKYVDAENHPQGQCYTDSIFKYRKQTKYMLFVDIDEFLQIRSENKRLLDLINEYFSKNENVGGVGFNWLCFGSSGLINRPKEGVIKSYLYRSSFSYEANKHIKTICNPRYVFRGSPHTPFYYKSYYTVNEDGKILNGPFNTDCQYKYFSLNHYAAKSLEEQKLKQKKGFGKTKLVHCNHDENDIYDSSMVDFYNNLKK